MRRAPLFLGFIGFLLAVATISLKWDEEALKKCGSGGCVPKLWRILIFRWVKHLAALESGCSITDHFLQMMDPIEKEPKKAPAPRRISHSYSTVCDNVCGAKKVCSMDHSNHRQQGKTATTVVPASVSQAFPAESVIDTDSNSGFSSSSDVKCGPTSMTANAMARC